MATVSVKLYGALVEAAKGEKSTQVEASNVRDLLNTLGDKYGKSFREKILDPSGGLQGFVNLFVNNTDIRHLKESETPLKEGDEVLLLPAVAGG